MVRRLDTVVMFPGYRIVEKLHESTNSLIWRGYRQADGLAVILKLLNQDYPTPERIVRFRQEFEILRNLQRHTSAPDRAGIIAVLDWDRYQHSFFMVLEDFGGTSLQNWMHHQRMESQAGITVPDFLNLAVPIVQAMGQVHQCKIIHKDINPSNIVYNPTTGQIKLIDFGLATALPREIPSFQSPQGLEGTLAYLSPEQTGRMNRTIDYRTDFYSLGITFYELLSGQLPFPTTDVLELLHCHLARQPLPLDERRDIPAPIAAIVMKLLAKDPVQRYQSTAGLIADLQQCQQWQQTGQFGRLQPGQHDCSDRFQLPQRLYGREAEIALLLAAFDRVSQPLELTPGTDGKRSPASPTSELILIAGWSGIGKTALARELYQPITRQRGDFITGKFDQFQRNVPYSAWIQAFRSLIRQLLTESEAAVQSWRERLLLAVGPNGQVLIDVIPEVELILGKQPAVDPLLPTEAQNRFRLLFQNFVRVFTRPDHPLVIFLDDLQWADMASLQLLEALVLSPDVRSLLIVGAYRDHEVSQSHPLRSTLETIRAEGKDVQTLILQTLGIPDITHLIADTLHCTLARAQPLADLIRTKTDGCPFFVRELLHSLYLNNLITFDYHQMVWRWDTEQIRAWQVSDNVVGLMTRQIQQLPRLTQQILQVAACLGNSFDLKTLALVQETSRLAVIQALSPAIAQGMVLALGESHQWLGMELPEITEMLTADYKFVHDRVQQATYDCLSDGNSQAIHYQIGHVLLQHADPGEREERIFEIVNHLNQGQALIQYLTERNSLAHLNLMAARKARNTAAYAAALTYCTTGLELLAPTGWEQHYSLMLNLCNQATEAAYMHRDFDTMDALVQTVQQHTTYPLEQVNVYQIKIQALICQAKLPEAIQTGREILGLLGVVLPEQPTATDAETALHALDQQLQAIDIEALLNLPAMTAPASVAIMQILTSLMPPAYNLMPHLFVLLVVQQVQRSIHEGNTALSCQAYLFYGILLCGSGAIDRGYRFGQLALTLLERLDARSIKAGVTHLFILFLQHWKNPVQDGLPISIAMYRLGLETGELLYGAYSAHVYCAYALFCGQALTRLATDLEYYTTAMRDLKQESALGLNRIVQQACLNLLGRSPQPSVLTGTAFDEQTALPKWQQVKNATAIFLLLIYRLMLSYLFGDYTRAWETITLAEDYRQGAVGMFYIPLFYFYDALTRLALVSDVLLTEPGRSHHLERVRENQQKLQHWATHAPANYEQKYYLVAAELARVEGRAGDARELYDRAIALAVQHEYCNDRALANELAARFYLAKNLPRIAQVYLQEAHYAYQCWGAIAKVQDLVARYSDLFNGAGTLSRAIANPIVSAHSETSSSQAHAVLDLTSVVKASQAISEEIVLPNLLKKLLQIAIENAGAQRGFLILGQPGHLTVEIGCQVSGESQPVADILVMQPIPLDEAGHYLSTAIVHYVARTQENMVLDSATEAGAFVQDVYVQRHQPKSVLCTPILRGGQLFGILYLENPLVTNSFTPDRVEALHLLSAQAAISLENARLYANLEQIVADRTAQLRSALVELETLATTDKLTGAYNRRKFEAMIDQEMSRALRFQHPFSLIALDIDYFKAINDTYGHLTGDRVLSTLAHLIQANIRNIDMLIRWGGEEFVVLAPETDRDSAQVLAEKLRQIIDRYTFQVVSHVTVSLGVTAFQPGDTLSCLMERADRALYQAKRHGRNRVEVPPDDTCSKD